MSKLKKFFIQKIKTQLENQYGSLKKITVMGIGMHGGGLSAVVFFHRLGIKIVATDLKKENELKGVCQKIKKLKDVELVLGHHRKRDFINTDLIIKNPAVANDSPFLEIARKNNIPIESDIGLFFELCPAPIIGITGTKGKSTTASLIAHFLKIKFPKVVLAGNIRTPVFDVLDKIDKTSKVVLELSSWQLESLKPHKKSPSIAVVLNIMPDHLNRYKNFNEYIAAKELIFKFQGPNDYLILNGNDSILKKISKKANSKIIFFDRDKLNQWKTCLYGEHNLDNLAAALEVARLFGISEKKAKDSLKIFKGLEGRMEIVAKRGGITFINDTTATIPEAAIAGMKSLIEKNPQSKIVLIAGGTDKNLDFKKFAQFIIQQVKNRRIQKVILLPGTATEKIKSEITRYNRKSDFIIEVRSMLEAVEKAQTFARKGDTVLLSPGAASFGLFAHEFERGKKFCQAIAKIFP